MFDMYCKSQFSHTVHLVTVTEISSYSECRFHSNIKALSDRWSQGTVEILSRCVADEQDGEGFSSTF